MLFKLKLDKRPNGSLVGTRSVQEIRLCDVLSERGVAEIKSSNGHLQLCDLSYEQLVKLCCLWGTDYTVMKAATGGASLLFCCLVVDVRGVLGTHRHPPKQGTRRSALSF